VSDWLLGLMGPLVVAGASWVLTERTYRRRPDTLTSMMVAAFAAKMVIFGAYVAVMLTVLSVRAVPFVVSFTGSFIVLHITEAFYLRRLFAGAVR
jgi:hypothetical protein